MHFEIWTKITAGSKLSSWKTNQIMCRYLANIYVIRRWLEIGKYLMWTTKHICLPKRFYGCTLTYFRRFDPRRTLQIRSRTTNNYFFNVDSIEFTFCFYDNKNTATETDPTKSNVNGRNLLKWWWQPQMFFEMIVKLLFKSPTRLCAGISKLKF